MTNELKSAVDSLSLEKFKRHIFLCADQTKPKCCMKEQALASNPNYATAHQWCAVSLADGGKLEKDLLEIRLTQTRACVKTI